MRKEGSRPNFAGRLKGALSGTKKLSVVSFCERVRSATMHAIDRNDTRTSDIYRR